MSYTVTGSDTTTTIAQNLASGFASLGSNSYFGATNHGPVITVTSTSPNVSRYTNGSGTITETESIAPVLSGTQTILIGGTKTTGDQLKLNVYDIGLASSPETLSYTVTSGDTLSSIATNLASAIAGDTNLTNIGVTAAASSSVVTISSSSVNATTYIPAMASTVTETMTMGLPPNGTATAVIGGTVSHTASDTVTVNVYDYALVEAGYSSPESVTYTVQSGDTTTANVATGLAAAIAADTKLSGIGIGAASPSNSSVVNITSNSVRATTYSVSAGSGATESISVSSAAGVLQSTYNNVNELTNINAGGPVMFKGTSNQPLVSASIATSVVSPSVYPSAYAESVSGVGTETLSLGQFIAGTQTATVGGTATTGDELSIEVTNSALAGGLESASYTVPSGSPSTTTMAAGLASAINADTHLQAIGVTATSTGAVVTIAANATTYTTTNGATEILTVYPNVNGTSAIAVSGLPTTSDVVKITVHNAALSAGSTQISYTVLSTDTLQTIASALVAGINGSSSLQALGVTAQNTTAAALTSTLSFTGSPILAAGSNLVAVAGTNGDSLTGSSNYQLPIVGTAYTAATSSGATETIALGANTNGNTSVTIGGSKSTGDQLTINVYNPSLGVGPESLTYTVLSTDTLTSIATALTSLINADTKLPSLGVSATSSSAVITIAVNGGAGRTLTHDANGNITGDGINTYQWDAENRLVQINYPGSGNYSQLTYDGLSKNVSIVETVGGSIASTKQFVWCGEQRCEERNASGTLTKQFFAMGQTISGNNYFYIFDHLGSIRGMTDSSGNVVSQFLYGMFGEVTQTVGTLASDFQFAGMYFHASSGLNLATYRAYNPTIGRWTNRDPAEFLDGSNMYAYAQNSPANRNDHLGLRSELGTNCLGGACGTGKWEGPDPGQSFDSAMRGLGYECHRVNSWCDCKCPDGKHTVGVNIIRFNTSPAPGISPFYGPWSYATDAAGQLLNDWHAASLNDDGSWTWTPYDWSPGDDVPSGHFPIPYPKPETGPDPNKGKDDPNTDHFCCCKK